ncbi:MAG: hypothetical protein L3J35_03155 [Bacteroidales bacterium]|nr:hypothetical protein [Bacteroidales bacterium]
MLSKNVIITIIVSLIFASAVAIITDNKIDDEAYKALFVHKVRTSEKYDIIIAGDSRIYRGISSKIIGGKLKSSAINLGFSSGGHSNLLFDLIDKRINLNSKEKIIILGITPLSLSKKASENGHIKRILKKKKEEILEYKYLFPVKNFFAPTSPAQIRKNLTEKGFNKYHQEFYIEDGWVASWYDSPFPYHALESYKKTFSETEISREVINNLYLKVKEWKSKGIKVYGFFVPSSINMEELEKNVGKFKPDTFLRGFFNAGGLWINIENSYESYDGSHLNKESAIRLSEEVADKIKNNNILTKYQSGLKINDIYTIKNCKFTEEKLFKSDSLNTLSLFIKENQENDSNSVKTIIFSEVLKKAKENNINKIKTSLNVYYTDSLTEAIFACKINNHKVEINTNYTTVSKKWCKLYLDYKFPENYAETDTLLIYIDNLKNTEFYIDSLKVYYY